MTSLPRHARTGSAGDRRTRPGRSVSPAGAGGGRRTRAGATARALALAVGLVLLALGAPAAAQQDGADDIYVTDIMETASALVLQPDGRFRWMFTAGALDLSAEGRWRRDGDAVLLDTEPPVTAPNFELLGSGRAEGAGLVVRITDESGWTPLYLSVEARYDSGEPAYARLQEDAYRFDPSSGRRVLSIRIGSAGFGFWSKSYPVPADANLMRIRFFPNDLGRVDFRGTRAIVDGDALTLPLMGTPVRYRRLTAAETAELQGAVDEIGRSVEAEDDPLAPMPDTNAAAAQAPPRLSGPVEISIRGALDPALDRVTEEHGNGLIGGLGPIDLRFRLGEQVIDFGRIGGDLHLLFGLRARRPSRAVSSLDFAFQDRLLTLDEALERARRLERQLAAAGFVPRPAAAARAEPEPFVATVHARSADRDFAPVRAAGWAGAAPLLADEAVGVSTLHLLNLRAGEIVASAQLQNLRRRPDDLGGTPALDFTGGREWRLEVLIELDPEIDEREAATSLPR